jgi:pyruvate,orthophosphate dikinase
MSSTHVYSFGDGQIDAASADRVVLGGKGAALAEMTRIGIPVPAGFTIPTAVSLLYDRESRLIPADMDASVDGALQLLEERMGRRFGDAQNPLLLAVRSGAQKSMPGMMDTILNVGLNDETVEGLAALTGNPRFAWDSYRRLLQMYGNVVLGVHHFYFEEELHSVREDAMVRSDDALNADHLRMLADRYKALIRERAREPFPQDPRAQLRAAIAAVFESWYNPRAFDYREMHGYSHDWGTAVNVQAMVFGNMGADCGTGVCFTRNPSTGEKVLFGEYLINAQGEDVVAGTRTPSPISGDDTGSLEASQPAAFAQLVEILERLETHYQDMQDVEFTIQNGRVWILQTRAGKRTAAADVRIATELVEEGMLDRAGALLRVSTKRLDSMLHPTVDSEAVLQVLARGLPASPGAASGRIVFSTAEAEQLAQSGVSCVLVREETSPEDIRGMKAAVAILTARGGMTSHAAVVARQMGKCCIVGCGSLVISEKDGTLRVGSTVLSGADIITVDGTSGSVIVGPVPLKDAELTPAFHTLMGWTDDARPISVRANADTVSEALLARRFGAEGIGLTRTEHMFFDDERINSMREMILAQDSSTRARALAKLRPYQCRDFEDIFDAMKGLPVTIRLLDPPLHEFLPDRLEDLEDLGQRLHMTAEEVRRATHGLHESNPMLGHRGCRLGISYPEIYEMQVRAIFDATLNSRAAGAEPMPEIMVPLVSIPQELASIRARINRIIATEYASDAEYLSQVPIGTMIELPRACMVAGELARHADFFSFGTNDLTQTVFGFSRDDVAGFLPAYLQSGLLEDDPFATLDIAGVGALIRMACERARATRPDIKIGLCGEHGGDPRSIEFVQNGLVDYVSCSPWRVPVARLASAQAALR